MNTILIAEDPSIFRYGLTQIIATMSSSNNVITADTTEEALQILASQSIALLIIGLHREVLDSIRTQHPETKVMIYTAADERTFAIDYLLAGANGYLSSSATREEMEQAVRIVLKGEKYMSGIVRQEMLDYICEKRKADQKRVGIY